MKVSIERPFFFFPFIKKFAIYNNVTFFNIISYRQLIVINDRLTKSSLPALPFDIIDDILLVNIDSTVIPF
jgi:hypothetical protein